MVLSKYARGRAREYRAMKILKNMGWLVARSAASHGPVDIFAGKDGKLILVQVKSGKSRLKKNELEELRNWGKSFNADAEVWYFGKRGKIERMLVYSPGK